MPSLTRRDIAPGTPLHDKIINEVKRRVKFSDRQYEDKRDQWRKADEAMVAYIPESEADSKRRHKREAKGDPKYTTIRIPYAYGVALSLHAYLVAVFMGRSPIFQFEGYEGGAEQKVLALEAMHHYQYNVGLMGPPMFCWLYDTAKYGVGIMGDYWQKTIRHVCSLQPQMDPVSGEMVGIEQVTEEIPGYEGNTFFNVSPFDFIPDPMVSMRDFQRGEFCGTRQRLSWQQCQERAMQGYYVNLDKVDGRIVPNFPTDTQRDRDTTAIQRPAEDMFNVELSSSGEDDDKRTPTIVPVYEMYINIIPSDWGLDDSSYPCKWVFTVTGDWKTVIGAAPFPSYHAEYPFNVNEMEFDAHALSNRGIPEITEGVGNTIDWLFNSRMFNVRASLNNLFVVDPLRVNVKDLTDPLPGGIIRRRAGAAPSGDKAVEQLLIADVTRTNVSDVAMMESIGEKATGVGDYLQGDPPSGGRRTATQARGEMASGTSRSKVISEYMSACGFASLGRHMIANSQQFYSGGQKFKIVGQANLMLAGQDFVEVPDAATIAGGFGFLMVDGTLPVDRFAQVNLWKEILAGMGQMPALLAQYDVGKIFAWVAQLGGIRNIANFRVQTAEQGLLQQQAQEGNVVPIGGQSNPNVLPQIAGNGPVHIGGSSAA